MRRKVYIRAISPTQIEVQFEDDWSKIVLARDAWAAEELESVFTGLRCGDGPHMTGFERPAPFICHGWFQR